MVPAIILLLTVLAYRIVMATTGAPAVVGLQNFSPMGALVLCGAAFLPKRWAVALPLVALFVSDLILNRHYNAPLVDWATLAQYLAFGLIAGIGWSLRDRPRGWRIFGASIVSSVLFYLVTNTAAWALRPEYEGGLSAWRQALTTGIPGYAPTWQFFRNTLVSDLIFTGLFVLCMSVRTPAAVREEEVVSV